MAESVVFCVIQAVGELLLYEARYLHGIRAQLEQIQTKLRRLQAISKIADAKQEEDERIRDWVAETRESAYIAEDILDIFAIEISLRKEKSLLQKYAGKWKEYTSLHHLGPNIQQIEAKISYLESDWRVSNIITIGQGDILDYVSERRQQIRRTYSHHEEDFVGLDEDVEKLVAHMVNEDVDRCYHVVSIIGMGGIGKTALTRKIYHHTEVRSHFHAFAWVCISRKWREEEILKRILNKLVPENREHINGMNDISELVKELFEVQKMKKCLVVLDDVWEKDVWKSLRPAFPNRKLGSKVLLTTRNKEIALHIDTDTKCFSYEQRHLNEDESWELLKKKAFPGIHMEVEDEFASGDEYEDARSSMDSFHSCLSDEETDEILGNVNTPRSECDIQDIRVQEDIEKIGKEMVGLCGGLPLAIIVLGGLLMTKSTLNEWRKVHQNFNSHLRRRRSLQENGIVYEVLALSYHDLPYQVKPCFLHLGNFPEDYEIPTRKLFQLWAAEGFILSDCHPSEEQESIMDIGERYLRELVQRCMVQIKVEESTLCLKSCQLHDLTRELCLLKGKEENFLIRIPLSDDPKLIGSSSSSSNSTSTSLIHRLAISVDSDIEKYFPPESENLDHVRSAVFFSRLMNRKHLQSTLELLCNGFKLLRVLDLERFDFGEKLCKDIGNLVHLRYLSLRGSQFYKLPSSIGKLKFLQTLDLRVPYHACLTIPDVLWKLTQLKHLYLPPSHKSTSKLQLGSLINLEILKNFDTRVSDFRDITKLFKLRKLTAILCVEMENLEAIYNSLTLNANRLRDSSFRIRFDFDSPRELTLLHQLVGGHHLRKLDLVGRVAKLPGHSHFYERITKLTLRNSSLEEDPMVTLEKLPNLYSLILRKNSFVGSVLRCSARGFDQLRTLEFQGLSFLEGWIVEEGSMPNLLRLTIDECISLRMVPEGIKFISTMREMLIFNMPESFKERVRLVEECGNNFYKITVRETNRDHITDFENPQGNTFSGLLRIVSPSLVPRDWQNP
ncbi:hypothetical protein ACJIZ3_013714 [Penstemon smallii]|uniref:Uncharacterized protein n=1 Tax=Penstemon smallii TaxID=265156 RepID=A0ABD3RKZ3_9LAMI